MRFRSSPRILLAQRRSNVRAAAAQFPLDIYLPMPIYGYANVCPRVKFGFFSGVLAPEDNSRTWRSKMNNRSVSLLGLVLLAAGLVACHNKSEEDLPVSMPSVIGLNGAGATFPYPIYSKWFDEYKKLHPGVQINYQPIGSGGGIKQFTDGTVDFGASDGPMTDEQLADFQKNHNATALHFPTALSADVPSYNLPGV